MKIISDKNKFPTKFKLISFYKEWEDSKNLLLKLKTFCLNENLSIEEKFQELSSLIKKFENQYKKKINNYYSDIIKYNKNNCINLQKAIKSYFTNDENKFYSKLLPFIIEQALLIEERANSKYGEQTLPLMTLGKNMKVSIPKLLFLSIFSNNFFCNDKDIINQLNSEQEKLTEFTEWNRVDFYLIYNYYRTNGSQVAIERIKCLLGFFDFAQKTFELKNNYFEKDIIIERIVFNQKEINKNLLDCEYIFEEEDINIHCKDMDNPKIKTQSIVNFANRNFQTGDIIPSATQEEVLFCLRPELYAAMFICQRVHENEIVIISNAYKLMENSGYLNTFKFEKFKDNIFLNNDLSDTDNENILCLDATFEDHYLFESVIQDISKFYSACNYCSKKYNNAGISTGSWGCGAFDGDKAHKFLQQIICAKGNNVKLSYSTFNNQSYCNSLIKLLKSVIKYKPKVSDLYKLIIGFKGKKNIEFHKYLKDNLGDEFYID